MNANPGIEAIRKLADMGFQFTVSGETIRAKYAGPGAPPALDVVQPLIDAARAHRDDVRFFLKCYCPKCGGCCFIPDYEGKSLCMACDWELLTRLYPALGVKH